MYCLHAALNKSSSTAADTLQDMIVEQHTDAVKDKEDAEVHTALKGRDGSRKSSVFEPVDGDRINDGWNFWEIYRLSNTSLMVWQFASHTQVSHLPCALDARGCGRCLIKH